MEIAHLPQGRAGIVYPVKVFGRILNEFTTHRNDYSQQIENFDESPKKTEKLYSEIPSSTEQKIGCLLLSQYKSMQVWRVHMIPYHKTNIYKAISILPEALLTAPSGTQG